MSRRRLTLTALVVGAALVQAVASAATRPSERACLLAWNAPTNASNHSRVIAGGPWSRASLRAGVVGTVTFEQGSKPTHTTAEACLLMLAKPGRLQPVTGIWRGSGVPRRSFTRTIRTDTALPAPNIRVLPDGRVTKIYRR